MIVPGAATEIALPGYRVTVALGALGRAASIVVEAAPAHRYAIVSDDNVARLYATPLQDALGHRASVHTVAAGERHKTRESWARLTDELLAQGAGRDTTVVALGGGMVGDLAGFVAATYMRGIPVVQIPTTLLAMVDASIGGKTAVDTPAGKNLVGAFHQPAAVVADPLVLRTLPGRELRAGLAEALKHGIIADAGYFDRSVHDLPRLVDPQGAPDERMLRLVARSIEIKADVVTADEREGGRRRILNFGHTLGHAIETASGYTLLHGEAIAIGMVLESELAERLSIADRGTSASVREALAAAGLPVSLPGGLDPALVLAATSSDKKARAGDVEYALPLRIGAMAGESSGWGIRVPGAEVRALLASGV